ncbi:hypothetical protein THASP1DRAFT_29573 [Thamnocephalis sphaerospora]|uniref:TM7S3/TM198-like domain-containing protein n=1 Tax=Thamnocephalis sphaerospora TaxID=78915 RepID=A0A4P9XRC0_9FUNG|nr:hypothetical protein THASP1DRAFT_29573 [Thamnocephalis sphaerospora]|eukprot:RKP08625.1 hypothetical protein THASP1DRAFT_29573 [Thamnocephalis sphaerospora]
MAHHAFYLSRQHARPVLPLLLLLLAAPTLTAADAIAAGSNSAAPSLSTSIGAAAIYLLAGVTLCIAGGWAAVPLFVATTLFGATCAVLAPLALISHGLSLGASSAVQTGISIAALIVGLILALTSTRYRSIGALSFGAVIGVCIALHIITAAGLANATVAVASIMAVMAVLGAWITYLLEPFIVTLITAFGGGMWCALAIDMLAGLGFSEAVAGFFYGGSGRSQGTKLGGGVYGMLALTLVLGLGGMVVQHYWLHRRINGYRFIRIRPLRLRMIKAA